MGLRDYYRQFEDVDEEGLRGVQRARRRREQALALQEVPSLDLSGTEWPELPSSEVVNASIYTARGRLNGYPDRHATGVRRALARRHAIEPERIVLGNGAAELLQAAALAILSQGDELVIPWPSYPLYPLMAVRAGGNPVPVDTGATGQELRAVRRALTPRSRLLVLCNPNDPTGAYVPSEAVGALLADLPDHVHVLLDEALIQFQDREAEDACLHLTEAFPRLLVVRTFSKIYGLSGLRAGYAVASAQSIDLLDKIAPVLGVNALTQAAVEQALKIGDAEIERRRKTVIEERNRLFAALKDLPVTAPESQANFAWLRAKNLSGTELATRLHDQGVIVAPGAPLGAENHVRATIRDSAATTRLLSALRQATKLKR